MSHRKSSILKLENENMEFTNQFEKKRVSFSFFKTVRFIGNDSHEGSDKNITMNNDESQENHLSDHNQSILKLSSTRSDENEHTSRVSNNCGKISRPRFSILDLTKSSDVINGQDDNVSSFIVSPRLYTSENLNTEDKENSFPFSQNFNRKRKFSIVDFSTESCSPSRNMKLDELANVPNNIEKSFFDHGLDSNCDISRFDRSSEHPTSNFSSYEPIEHPDSQSIDSDSSTPEKNSFCKFIKEDSSFNLACNSDTISLEIRDEQPNFVSDLDKDNRLSLKVSSHCSFWLPNNEEISEDVCKSMLNFALSADHPAPEQYSDQRTIDEEPRGCQNIANLSLSPILKPSMSYKEYGTSIDSDSIDPWPVRSQDKSDQNLNHNNGWSLFKPHMFESPSLQIPISPTVDGNQSETTVPIQHESQSAFIFQLNSSLSTRESLSKSSDVAVVDSNSYDLSAIQETNQVDRDEVSLHDIHGVTNISFLNPSKVQSYHNRSWDIMADLSTEDSAKNLASYNINWSVSNVQVSEASMSLCLPPETKDTLSNHSELLSHNISSSMIHSSIGAVIPQNSDEKTNYCLNLHIDGKDDNRHREKSNISMSSLEFLSYSYIDDEVDENNVLNTAICSDLEHSIYRRNDASEQECTSDVINILSHDRTNIFFLNSSELHDDSSRAIISDLSIARSTDQVALNKINWTLRSVPIVETTERLFLPPTTIDTVSINPQLSCIISSSASLDTISAVIPQHSDVKTDHLFNLSSDRHDNELLSYTSKTSHDSLIRDCTNISYPDLNELHGNSNQTIISDLLIGSSTNQVTPCKINWSFSSTPITEASMSPCLPPLTMDMVSNHLSQDLDVRTDYLHNLSSDVNDNEHHGKKPNTSRSLLEFLNGDVVEQEYTTDVINASIRDCTNISYPNLNELHGDSNQTISDLLIGSSTNQVTPCKINWSFSSTPITEASMSPCLPPLTMDMVSNHLSQDLDVRTDYLHNLSSDVHDNEHHGKKPNTSRSSLEILKGDVDEQEYTTDVINTSIHDCTNISYPNLNGLHGDSNETIITDTLIGSSTNQVTPYKTNWSFSSMPITETSVSLCLPSSTINRVSNYLPQKSDVKTDYSLNLCIDENKNEHHGDKPYVSTKPVEYLNSDVIEQECTTDPVNTLICKITNDQAQSDHKYSNYEVSSYLFPGDDGSLLVVEPRHYHTQTVPANECSIFPNLENVSGQMECVDTSGHSSIWTISTQNSLVDNSTKEKHKLGPLEQSSDFEVTVSSIEIKRQHDSTVFYGSMAIDWSFTGQSIVIPSSAEPRSVVLDDLNRSDLSYQSSIIPCTPKPRRAFNPSLATSVTANRYNFPTPLSFSQRISSTPAVTDFSQDRLLYSATAPHSIPSKNQFYCTTTHVSTIREPTGFIDIEKLGRMCSSQITTATKEGSLSHMFLDDSLDSLQIESSLVPELEHPIIARLFLQHIGNPRLALFRSCADKMRQMLTKYNEHVQVLDRAMTDLSLNCQFCSSQHLCVHYNVLRLCKQQLLDDHVDKYRTIMRSLKVRNHLLSQRGLFHINREMAAMNKEIETQIRDRKFQQKCEEHRRDLEVLETRLTHTDKIIERCQILRTLIHKKRELRELENENTPSMVRDKAAYYRTVIYNRISPFRMQVISETKIELLLMGSRLRICAQIEPTHDGSYVLSVATVSASNSLQPMKENIDRYFQQLINTSLIGRPILLVKKALLDAQMPLLLLVGDVNQCNRFSNLIISWFPNEPFHLKIQVAKKSNPPIRFALHIKVDPIETYQQRPFNYDVQVDYDNVNVSKIRQVLDETPNGISKIYQMLRKLARELPNIYVRQ